MQCTFGRLAMLVAFLVCLPGPSPSQAQFSRIKELSSKAAGATKEKVAEFLGAVRESSAVFREAGYEVRTVEVSLGLIPSVEMHFAQTRVLTDEEMTQVLETHKESGTVCAVIQALSSVNEFDLSGFRVDGIKIVGPLPLKTILVLSPIPPTAEPAGN